VQFPRRKTVPTRSLESFTILHSGVRRLVLNRVGGRIWSLLDGNHTITDIANILATEVSRPVSRLNEQVEGFLTRVTAYGLLESTTSISSTNSAVTKETNLASALDECSTPRLGNAKVTSLADEVDAFYWKNFYIQKMHLELTYRCNFRCVHCYNATHLGGSSELLAEQWSSVLSQLAAMGCYFLTFTGGELFIRPDTIDILQSACDLGFSFRINTNGSLVNERLIAKLESLRPFMQGIDVSFYGATADVHDVLSKKIGSFANTKRAVQLLVSAGFPTLTKYITMKDNFDGLSKFEEDMHALGVPFMVHTGSLIPRTDRNRAPLVQLLTDAQYLKLLSTHPDSHSSAPNACRPGHVRGAITPEGDVSPCEWLTDFKLGSLKSQTLREVWYAQPFASFRSVFEQESECIPCDLRPGCNRCPAHSYLETGNLLHCAPIQRHNAELYRNHAQA
jgi:radical SAM protein with 4Fe4S-binding SPASM domain